MKRIKLLEVLALLGAGLLAGCGDGDGDDTPPPPQGLYVVSLGGERFVVQLSDEVMIQCPDGYPDQVLSQVACAERQLAGEQEPLIVFGELAAGSAGYNIDPKTGQEWSWHLVPESIGFAEMMYGLCDAPPSWVESHLDQWLEIGQYCPWSGELESKL